MQLLPCLRSIPLRKGTGVLVKLMAPVAYGSMVFDEDYFARKRPEVAALVPRRHHRVLDVGCGEGLLALSLKRRGHDVVGIEANAAAAATARSHLGDVIELDLNDRASLCAFVASRLESFDCVVAADVLEHLRDPWATLEQLVKVVQPGGLVVVSLPNVRCLSVVAPLLLKGQFEYQSHGVLDRTHLRFFTRSSAVALLGSAGLAVRTVDRAPTPWRGFIKNGVGLLLGDLGNEQFLLTGVRE